VITVLFVCFLDASKAYDCVDYTILFCKLVTREVQAYILCLLWNWYVHHYATRSPAVARDGRPYLTSRKTVIPSGIGLAYAPR